MGNAIWWPITCARDTVGCDSGLSAAVNKVVVTVDPNTNPANTDVIHPIIPPALLAPEVAAVPSRQLFGCHSE